MQTWKVADAIVDGTRITTIDDWMGMRGYDEIKGAPWQPRPVRGAWRRLSSLALSGPGLPVLFVAVYACAYLIRFPVLTWYAKVPKQTFVTITGPLPLPAIGLASANVVLVALCWRMWKLSVAQPGRAVRRLVLAGWLGATMCAVLTFPGQSTDMGDYIFRAHMLVHMQINPLTTPPSQVIPLKQFPYLSWYWEPDSYGPLWQGLSGAVHALAGENLLTNYLAYKTLAAATMALSAWLIYSILARTAPAYAVAGMGLWLWNPVVLNEGPLHGHNDILIVPLVLGSLWLAQRGRGALGIVLLVAVTLIKASLWFLLPVEGLWILRQGLRHGGSRRAVLAVALSVLAGALLVWLAYLPFGGWHRLIEMAQKRAWWPTASWTAAVFFALRDGLRWLSHQEAVRWVIGGATALFVALSAIAVFRLRDLFVAAWAATLAYLLVGSQWFQPWYAVWLIGIAAVIRSKHITEYTLVFSVFMLLHPIVQQYWLAGYRLPPGAYHAAMAATTLLVPQFLAVYLVLKRRLPA